MSKTSSNAEIGISVAIDGPYAIVGATSTAFAAAASGLPTGAAYVFDTASGRQMAKLVHDDVMPFDNFGTSVGIQGSTAIVGRYTDDPYTGSTGSAYLFDAVTATQLQVITVVDDSPLQDVIGAKVAIDAGRVMLGAYRDAEAGSNVGAAYLVDLGTQPLCTSDTDWDGDTDIDDLVAVILDWGSDGSVHGGDVDGSGSVDVDDVVAVVLAWGPC